jgi:phosphonopyruvate decarboxylase/sulfopyruvate decarboxylase subunit beta
MYRLPCLLVVTWRGFRGEDAPEHLLMGDISPRLLELAGIPHRTLSAVSVEEDLAWATRETFARETPVALLIPPGVLESEHGRSNDPDRDGAGTRPGSVIAAGHGRADGPGARAQMDDPARDRELVPRVSRYDALRTVIGCLGEEPVIHANGYICRESYAVADRPRNFYMLGSMGLASSIGLGVALTRPGRKTVVFDGDGNLLMNLGSLAMAGGLGPKNLVHFVFDNEAYASTGDQPSLSREVRLDRLATAAGYPWVRAVTDASALETTTREVLDAEGPAFVCVKVTRESRAVPRIPYSPTEIRDRFKAALGTT